MDPVTIAAAITATIKLYNELAGDEAKRQQWEQRLQVAAKLGAGAVDALGDLYEEVTEATLMRAQRIRAEQARLKNPAFYRGPVSLFALVLGLAMLGGCARSPMTRLDAAPGLRAGYAVEWPEDVSRDPEAFQTVEIDGRMITTVPTKDR
jgi:hypothetical protein